MANIHHEEKHEDFQSYRTTIHLIAPVRTFNLRLDDTPLPSQTRVDSLSIPCRSVTIAMCLLFDNVN